MKRLDDVGILLHSPPAEFKRVRHIEYLEGPLITEFQVVPDGEPYLFIWRARDNEFNRWLAIRTTKRDITLYENRSATLHALMQRAVTGFLVDIDGRGLFKQWRICSFEQLPEAYVPSPSSLYDPDLRPPGDRNRKRGQSILIDGEWELQDIIDYSRRFRDVYAAEYLLSEEARTGPRDGVFNYLMQGGYVYNTFFNQLSSAIPKKDQARVRTFQYASPGIIEMDLNEDVAAMVTRRVRQMKTRIEEAREIYREVRRWLAAQDKPDPPKKPIPSTNQTFLMVNDLTEIMGFIDFQRLQTLTKNDLKQTTLIVLACFRRIDTLVRYETLEKATLVAELTASDGDDDDVVGPEDSLSDLYDEHEDDYDDDDDDEDDVDDDDDDDDGS